MLFGRQRSSSETPAQREGSTPFGHTSYPSRIHQQRARSKGLCFECDSKLPGHVFLLLLARTPFSGAQQKPTPPGRPVEPTLVLTAISSLLAMRLTIHRPKIFWTSVAASQSAILQCCTLLGFLTSFLLPRRQPATGASWSSPSPTGTHATSGQPSSRRSVKHGSRRPTGSLRSSG